MHPDICSAIHLQEQLCIQQHAGILSIFCPHIFFPSMHVAPFFWHPLLQQLVWVQDIALITQTPFKVFHSSWLEVE